MDLYDAVIKRQSVRKYKPDAIPEGVLNRVLGALRAAPSWTNVQPWELVLITDPEMRQRLQQTLPKGNPAAKAIVDAPLLICLIGITGISGWYKGQLSTARGEWLLFDLGIAAEHLCLAAAAEGLGTVHCALFDYEKAGQILELPKDRTLVELIPLGYPAHEPKRIDRKPLNEFVFKEAYGRK